jgi:hypothetical protein
MPSSPSSTSSPFVSTVNKKTPTTNYSLETRKQSATFLLQHHTSEIPHHFSLQLFSFLIATKNHSSFFFWPSLTTVFLSARGTFSQEESWLSNWRFWLEGTAYDHCFLFFSLGLGLACLSVFLTLLLTFIMENLGKAP